MGWTLAQAAWINALLGNDEKGLNYDANESQRYRGDFFTIYTLAFGGKATERSKSVMQELYLKDIEGDDLHLAKAAMTDLLRGHTDRSVDLLEKAMQANDPWYAVFAALLCENKGWFERRDIILSNASLRYHKLINPKPNRQEIKEFIDRYIAINERDLLTDDDIDFLKAYAKRFPNEAFDVDAHAFAGELLRLKGKEATAKQVFSDILSTQYRNRIIEFMPYKRLREMGEDPCAILRSQKPKLMTNDEQ
ncbi:MAG: hypothetical protein V3V05_09155 [Pontiella sp.]